MRRSGKVCRDETIGDGLSRSDDRGRFVAMRRSGKVCRDETIGEGLSRCRLIQRKCCEFCRDSRLKKR